MPDLMEGQSRHRECAQETQAKRLIESLASKRAA
jgi:hypothetical protein